MAVRTTIPIFVDEEVMNMGAYDSEKESELEFESKDKKTSSFEPVPDRLEQLKIDLKNAVENEEYERAASLRDEIKKIESES
jgi:protein-arginine kinase activator protein McsA